jgi:hypothetical protein
MKRWDENYGNVGHIISFDGLEESLFIEFALPEKIASFDFSRTRNTVTE